MGRQGSIKKPSFIISLDVELLWGYVLHPNHRMVSVLRADSSNGRKAITTLLGLFDKHNAPVTWALIINPAYELSRRGRRIFLKQIFRDENFAKESPLTEKYLPERCVLPAAFLCSGTSRAMAKEISSEQAGAEIEELMRESVVINASRGYG